MRRADGTTGAGRDSCPPLEGARGEAIRVALDRVRVLLDVDAAALHAADPRDGRVRRVEGTGALLPPADADVRAAFEAAVRRGDPFLAASVRSDETLHVPLAADGQVHALLSVARTDGRGFGPVELDRACALGALLATSHVAWRGPEAAADVEESLLVLAHQLRSPLAAVVGAAQALGPHATVRQRRFVEIVARNAERALRLIGDALRAGGAGRVDVPLDLGALARRAAEDAALAGRTAGLRLDVRVPPDGGPTVRGDATLLAQVLDNLLGNAAAYTPHGGTVVVSVAAEPAAGRVRLEVQDTGPGIAEADRDRVFDPFRRGADAVARGVPGSGLGLAVVRAIVGAHGGTVTVDDAPGGGARVRVLLPEADGAAGPVAGTG